MRRSYEQVIDETFVDDRDRRRATRRTRPTAPAHTVESFERFIEEHKDEITALQILYSRPYGSGSRSARSRSSANAIGRPPYQWTPEKLWRAYEALDRSKVRGSGQRVLTDVVSLVRFALHQDGELVPYPGTRARSGSTAWLLQQENAGRTFTAEQLAWLERIRDHVAASLDIADRRLRVHSVRRAWRPRKAGQVFGERSRPLLDELARGAGGLSELPDGWAWKRLGRDLRGTPRTTPRSPKDHLGHRMRPTFGAAASAWTDMRHSPTSRG